MRVHICDVCGEVIKEWEKVKYTEWYVGCEYTELGVFPHYTKRKVTLEMCMDCHKEFRDYLEACAVARKK